jgi:hypothetical protein
MEKTPQVLNRLGRAGIVRRYANRDSMVATLRAYASVTLDLQAFMPFCQAQATRLHRPLNHFK